MTNAKLQVALDELERLRDTVIGFKERNGTLPNPDSDAGRALFSLESFTSELHKLNLGKLLNRYRRSATFGSCNEPVRSSPRQQ